MTRTDYWPTFQNDLFKGTRDATNGMVDRVDRQIVDLCRLLKVRPKSRLCDPSDTTRRWNGADRLLTHRADAAIGRCRQSGLSDPEL